MKKTIIYFCVGAVLTGLVLIAYDALATTPNPGHPLTCSNVTCAFNQSGCTATCTTGILTGGGYFSGDYQYTPVSSYPSGNGWYCCSPHRSGTCYARCCIVGI